MKYSQHMWFSFIVADTTHDWRTFSSSKQGKFVCMCIYIIGLLGKIIMNIYTCAYIGLSKIYTCPKRRIQFMVLHAGTNAGGNKQWIEEKGKHLYLTF